MAHDCVWGVACLFVDLRDGMIDLVRSGAISATPLAVNERGHIIGNSGTADGQQHALRRTQKHGMIDLGTLGGGHSLAVAINTCGEIVGASVTADGKDLGVHLDPRARHGWSR